MKTTGGVPSGACRSHLDIRGQIGCRDGNSLEARRCHNFLCTWLDPALVRSETRGSISFATFKTLVTSDTCTCAFGYKWWDLQVVKPDAASMAKSGQPPARSFTIGMDANSVDKLSVRICPNGSATAGTVGPRSLRYNSSTSFVATSTLQCGNLLSLYSEKR